MKPYDLSPYKLTTPQANPKTGHALEILQPALNTYNSDYFTQNGKSFIFRCPDGGATTPGSDKARCELRDMREFSVLKDQVFDGLILRINKLPPGGSVVLHQLHDKEEPWYMFCGDEIDGEAEFKVIYRDKNNGVHHTQKIPDRFPLSTLLKPEIEVFPPKNGQPAKLEFIFDKFKRIWPLYRDDSNGLTYPKRGNYNQIITKKGLITEVEHFG